MNRFTFMNDCLKIDGTFARYDYPTARVGNADWVMVRKQGRGFMLYEIMTVGDPLFPPTVYPR